MPTITRVDAEPAAATSTGALPILPMPIRTTFAWIMVHTPAAARPERRGRPSPRPP